MVQAFLGTIGFIKAQEIIKGTVDDNWGPGNVDTVNNYIKDGLILHLDAIKNTRLGHNSKSLTWENLVNSNDFKDGILKGDATWTEDSLYLNGVNGSGVLFDTIKDFQNTTIEVVFKYDEPVGIPNAVLVGNVQVAGTGVGNINVNYFGVWRGNESKTYDLYPIQPVNDNKTYLAFSSGADLCKVYNHNLEVFSGSTNSIYASDAPWAVGANPAENGDLSATIKGHIYAVRIYNRQLSDVEISHNRGIDNIRFKLASYDLNYGSSTDNYVQDDLYIHLDGINNTGTGHNDNASSWKNLGSSSPTNATKIGNPVFDSNSIILNGVDQWIRVARYTPSSLTVEQVLKFNSLPENRAIPIGNFDAGGYGYYPIKDKWVFMIHVGGSTYEEVILEESYKVNEIFASSASYDGEIINLNTDKYGQKTVNVPGRIKSPANSTYIVLGVNPTGSQSQNADWFGGHIYNTRLYSRALNDIEVQYNRRIDKERFNL